MEANGGAGVGYNFNEGEVSSLSVSGGVGYGIVGVGGSYDFANGGWNASAGLQSRTYGTAGIGYGSNGFNWYLGGSDETVRNINESVQNRLIFGASNFITNDQFDARNPNSTVAADALAIANKKSAKQWSAKSELPEEYASSNGDRWGGRAKCNRLLQCAAGAPTGKNINDLATSKLGNRVSPQPGASMVMENREYKKSGHGIILGQKGEFIHARTAEGMQVTRGWSRYWYMNSNKERWYDPVYINY